MEKNSYYTVNRYLLQICGVWPYDNTRLQCVRAALTVGILVVYVLYQLTSLFAHKCNFELIIKIGSVTLPMILCSLQFITFWFNKRDLKDLLNLLFAEWQKILKDWRELEILQKCAKSSKKLTILLLLYALLVWFFLLLIHLAPIVVNRVANVSVTKRNNILTNELDADRIIYICMVFVADLLVTATSTTTLGFMWHVCAMLKLSCYRIEHSLDVNRYMSIPQKERLMFRKLISAVSVHRKAIRSIKYGLSNFKYTYFFMIVLGVASFAVNLLQAIQAALIFDSVANFLNSSFYVPIHIIYFFVLNYGGQLILDHDVEVLKTLYSIQWYVAPIRVQKLILFLMLRYTRSFTVVIGGIYVASLEGFVTLTSMSLSYFMVIYSVQR